MDEAAVSANFDSQSEAKARWPRRDPLRSPCGADCESECGSGGGHRRGRRGRQEEGLGEDGRYEYYYEFEKGSGL